MSKLLIDPKLCPDIILDLDDVICDLGGTIHPLMNQITGINLSYDQLVDHHFLNIYPGLTEEMFDEMMIDNQVFETTEPLPGAIESIHALKRYGYNIHICTARGGYSHGYRATAQWLYDYNVPYDNLMVSQYQKSKSQVYRQSCAQVSYLFDDGIHNIEDAISSDIVMKPYMVTTPWNAHVDKVMRTPSLHQFCVEHGLL